MQTRERRLLDSTVLLPEGRIDLSNADVFKHGLLEAVATTKTALVLDLSGIEYLSSAGLRCLMIAAKAGKARGVAVAVAAMRPLVREIFTISRFDQVLACFETVRDALERLDPPALRAQEGS